MILNGPYWVENVIFMTFPEPWHDDLARLGPSVYSCVDGETGVLNQNGRKDDSPQENEASLSSQRGRGAWIYKSHQCPLHRQRRWKGVGWGVEDASHKRVVLLKARKEKVSSWSLSSGSNKRLGRMKTEPHLLKLALRDFSWSGDGEARFQWRVNKRKKK